MADNFQFNVGKLFGLDTNGNPIQFGLLQDVSLDISRTLKELLGANAFAEAIALGSGKISGKASSAEFNSTALNMMMGGLGDITQGQHLMASEAVTLSSSIKDYTAVHSAVFERNLGVNDVTNPLLSVPQTMSLNTALTTPSAPTVTASPSGGSIPAGTYSVKVAAINQLGYNSLTGFLDQQVVNLKNPAKGITEATAAVSTSALTGSNNQILASVPAVAGALAYAWYVGSAAGDETLQKITTSNNITLLTMVTGGDAPLAAGAGSTGTMGTSEYLLDPVTLGKYSFNAVDASLNKKRIVNYIWKDNSGGTTINLSNKEMGVAQYFSLFLSSPLVTKAGIQKQCNVMLNCCVSSKLAFGWKLGDFQKPQFDFQAASDAAGGLGWISIG